MKQFVIGVNDVVFYVALFLLYMFSAFMASRGDVPQALVVAVGGTLAWCILSGLWFVLSGIHEELVKANKARVTEPSA